MKKKRKLIMFASAILLIGAIVVWFSLSAIKPNTNNSNNAINFLDLTFGKKEKILGLELVAFKFSFLNLLTVLLLLAGALFSVFSLASKKGLISSNIDNIVVFLLSAGALALTFFVKEFTITGDGIGQILGAVIDDFKFAEGVYVIAGLTGASGLLNLLGLFS